MVWVSIVCSANSLPYSRTSLMSCLKEYFDILYVNICMHDIVELFLHSHCIQQENQNNNYWPLSTLEVCFYLCIVMCDSEQKF